MRGEVLRMEGVTYLEQGVPRLEDIHLSIREGEILGLIPVRGHGLTALIQLLQDNLPLKYGYIYYCEELINSWHNPSPHPNRIATIRSTSSLVEGLTVADNIFVLRNGFRSFLVNPTVLDRQLQPFLDEIGVNISSNSYVETLSTFERVVVELVKAVVVGCHLVILRDVDTFVSESELASLHKILRHYTQRGMSFLYIGFHFEALAAICARTAMMINGRITKIMDHHGSRPSCSAFYEQKMLQERNRKDEQISPPQCVFEAQSLSGGGVKDLSFSAMAGECLVLQDLDNCVIGSLLDILKGNETPDSGMLLLSGHQFVPESNRQLAIVSEDATHTMIFREMSYLDNLCFTMDHRMPEIWRSRRVQEGLCLAYTDLADEELFFKHPAQLSMREKYDLVYHRILIQSPKVVFCVQPFRGADMELRMHIWSLLEKLMEQGIAVVILAVNLSDSLALSSELIRIHQSGRCEIYSREEFGSISFSAPWVGM